MNYIADECHIEHVHIHTHTHTLRMINNIERIIVNKHNPLYIIIPICINMIMENVINLANIQIKSYLITVCQ